MFPSQHWEIVFELSHAGYVKNDDVAFWRISARGLDVELDGLSRDQPLDAIIIGPQAALAHCAHISPPSTRGKICSSAPVVTAQEASDRSSSNRRFCAMTRTANTS